MTSFSIVILLTDKTLFFLIYALMGSLLKCALCFAGMLAKHITFWWKNNFLRRRRLSVPVEKLELGYFELIYKLEARRL